MENDRTKHHTRNDVMKNVVLVILLQFSFIVTAQHAHIEYLEVRLQHQKFKGSNTLKSFLNRHKRKHTYKNAPCQFYLRCTFYLNERGYVDSISAFKTGQYVLEPRVTFWNEIQHEIEVQSKNYRFYNQVIDNNDTVNLESISLFLDYECGKGWIINKYPSEFKKFKKSYKDIFLNYRKE